MRTLLAAAAVLFAAGRSPANAGTLHLRYALYVHGLHVMQVDATLRIDGDHYEVNVADHTVGLIGALIDTHTTSLATGTLDAQGAHPAQYESAGHSRGADRRTVIDWTAGVPVVRVLTPVEPKREVVPTAATTATVDALSALAALVERTARSGACDATFRIFDGARLSDFTTHSGGMFVLPRIERSPYAGTALRCDFTSRQVAGFLHDDNYARAHDPQTGTAWVAPVVGGAPPVPVRADFSTPDHGPVAAYLVAASAASIRNQD